MDPAIVLGGLLGVGLLALGAAMRRAGRPGVDLRPTFRRALPWIGGAMLLTAVALGVLDAPVVVVAALTAYTGIAVAGTWRMVRLDGASPWMTPAHRRTRLAISIVGLTWLGIVLGLLLRIADQLARAAYGPT